MIKSLPIARRKRVVFRYQELQRGKKRIVSDPDIEYGEPVFEGTRIPLAHIAGLIAKGVPFTELIEVGAQPWRPPLRGLPIQEEAHSTPPAQNAAFRAPGRDRSAERKAYKPARLPIRQR
jgi:uncharacterized protein DUF433